MADYIDHIRQAEHNEALGELLVANPQFRDWLITVAFYAAIHYVEADFTKDSSIQHTERSKPKDVSAHVWREQLVEQRYSKDCFKSYRKLREASQDVRYLVRAIRRGQTGIAPAYYSQEDAERFFRHHLEVVKADTMQSSQ